MKNIKYLCVIFGAFMLTSVTFAATYFLVSFNMTYAADQAAEYASVTKFFLQSQAALNSRGSWREGDLFDVAYSDGTVAQFKLTARGKACSISLSGLYCIWGGTVPLESIPTIIQQKRSSSGPSPIKISLPPNSLLPAYVQFDPSPVPVRTWTITVGGSPLPTSSGCGGSGRPCALPE